MKPDLFLVAFQHLGVNVKKSRCKDVGFLRSATYRESIKDSYFQIERQKEREREGLDEVKPGETVLYEFGIQADTINQFIEDRSNFTSLLPVTFWELSWQQ